MQQCGTSLSHAYKKNLEFKRGASTTYLFQFIEHIPVVIRNTSL